MNNKELSFSNLIKHEILMHEWNEEARMILVFSFLQSNLIYRKNKYFLKITFEKNDLNLFLKFFINYFSIDNLNYEEKNISFNLDDKSKKILSEIKNNLKEKYLLNKENSKAYLAGLFLAKGLINSPKAKSNHLEIRIKNLEEAKLAKDCFRKLSINIKVLKKNNWYYLYIKKATIISDVLKIFYSTEALIIFEDERIFRDFTSVMKKTEGIENYNKDLILLASKKQIAAINIIIKNDKIKLLDLKIQNLALLRKENPGISLSELQYLYNVRFNQNVSKSTINNWMQRILELSKEEK